MKNMLISLYRQREAVHFVSCSCVAACGKRVCSRVFFFFYSPFITSFDCTCGAQHPALAGVLPLDLVASLATRRWTPPTANRKRAQSAPRDPRHPIGC